MQLAAADGRVTSAAASIPVDGLSHIWPRVSHLGQVPTGSKSTALT